MPQQCFNRVGAPPVQPQCEPTRFLCTVCPETCGLCTPSSERKSCEDLAPLHECELFTKAYASNQTAASVHVPATGYCDSLIGSRKAGVWKAGDSDRRSGLHYRPSFHYSPALGKHLSSLAELNAAHAKLPSTVVFLGDSNMRYQYLSLVSFLKTGRWPARPPPRTFSVCWETSVLNDPRLKSPAVQALNRWHNFSAWKKKPTDRNVASWKWQTFFNQTSDQLAPQETCECELRGATMMENRLFEMDRRPKATDDGKDNRSKLKVAFLWMVGNGHLSTQANWTGGWDATRLASRHSCDAGRCQGRTLQASNAEFLSNRLAPLHPNVVIFGPGPWMRTKGAAGLDEVRDFLIGVKRIVGPLGRAIFRTCPRGFVRLAGRRGCSNGVGCDEAFRALLRETGWELFDLYAMTEDLWTYVEDECTGKHALGGPLPNMEARLKGNAAEEAAGARTNGPACKQALDVSFSDNVHFQCSVYREMNRLLLAQSI